MLTYTAHNVIVKIEKINSKAQLLSVVGNQQSMAFTVGVIVTVPILIY